MYAEGQFGRAFFHTCNGLSILAINYGSPRACPYPRQSKLPAKWSFVSHAVFKNSELAPRTPVFTEDALVGDNGEVEVVKPPERSFWAKYMILLWMYSIPLGLIVMNAMTQAMNMPKDGAGGQGQQGTARAPAVAARRR